MTPELEVALDAATQAGQITLQYFQTRSLKVMLKRDRSPVTQADKEAEKKIRSVIKSAFPKDGFLGEEFGEIKSKSGRRWIIDPIDGTKSFIHGVPMYGVMIGLEVEKFVQVGVVNFPALGEIFYAECGSGAYCNLQRITVSAIDTISDATLCITSEKNLRETDTLSPYTALKDRALLTRTWGDCYGHCLVAAGRAEIMIDPVMNPWDCAALVPIVEEAGGRCFDHHGEPTIYGKGFISTNAALAPVVMEQLKSTLAKPKRKR